VCMGGQGVCVCACVCMGDRECVCVCVCMGGRSVCVWGLVDGERTCVCEGGREGVGPGVSIAGKNLGRMACCKR